MADIRLGGAVVEVSLDMKKAQEQAAAFGKAVPIQKSLVAEEKQKASAVKATSAAIDEQTRKIHALLGIQATTQRQVASAAAVSGVKSGSVRGMMGAQLTYALQDMLTGASMGNMNQALLGMSNNLSMIAMLWGGISGTITSVAVAALPLLYTGFKAFIGQQKEAKDAVDALTKAFERQKFAMGLNAIARQVLNDKDVQRMRDAGHVQERLDAEKRGIDDINEAIEERKKILGRKEGIAAGFEEMGGLKVNESPLMKGFEELRQQQIKGGIIPGPGFSPAQQGRIKGEMGLPGGIGDYEFQRQADGSVKVRRRTTAAERTEAGKQVSEIQGEIKTMETERGKREQDTAKLTTKRNELLRRDLGFMQRTANAGFNNYERAKIDLEKKQAQERQELRDRGFEEIPLGPRMTEREKEERIDASNKAEQEELDANLKAMNERHEKSMIHGRHLSKKEIKEFADNETEIHERHAKDRDRIVKEFEEGPGTLLDPAMKALKTEQARERALLAQRFAGPGAPGHFASMEGLAKDIQTKIGGDKGLDFAQQTAGNTKSIAEAQQDLITAVKELNLGFGP